MFDDRMSRRSIEVGQHRVVATSIRGRFAIRQPRRLPRLPSSGQCPRITPPVIREMEDSVRSGEEEEWRHHVHLEIKAKIYTKLHRFLLKLQQGT